MEVDIEELGKLLYPDGPPDNEDFQNYIVQLASCGVEKLGREGSHLKDERNQILEETRDLVYKNYKTFIHSADCSQTIFREFSNVEEHLEKLISGLPSLKSSVDEFLVTSRSLSQSRHTTSLTLGKHTQLLEILELPQLMDTCVRNGYYEDALEVLSYVKRVEKKHLDIPIVAAIVSEVKGGTRLMLLQLLLQLRSPLTLPQCLKTVGLLRRLDVFSDSELKLKFLQTRDSWLSSLIRAIPKDDAFVHISKVVEVSRVHLFDIVTQFRAIFSDEDSRLAFGEDDVNEQAIFQGWIVHKVNQFLSILEADLGRGVGPNLESLLNQCMFFGQSFSRVGADFRNLLIPIFQSAAFRSFAADVRSANFKFDECLSSFSLMGIGAVASSAVMADTQDKTSPPLSLMEFLPLAHYTNGLVSAFNGLRHCCPLALLQEVVDVLQTSFAKVVSALCDLHRLESSGFTATEESSFARMASLLPTALLPFLGACLRKLFPLQAIADATGVTITELHKQKIGELDVDALIKPLEPFLPSKPLTTTITTREETTTDDNPSEPSPKHQHWYIGETENEDIEVGEPHPVEGEAKPVEEEAKPVEEEPKSGIEETQSVIDGIQPIVEETKPVVDGSQPLEAPEPVSTGDSQPESLVAKDNQHDPESCDPK